MYHQQRQADVGFKRAKPGNQYNREVSIYGGGQWDSCFVAAGISHATVTVTETGTESSLSCSCYPGDVLTGKRLCYKAP